MTGGRHSISGASIIDARLLQDQILFEAVPPGGTRSGW